LRGDGETITFLMGLSEIDKMNIVFYKISYWYKAGKVPAGGMK